MTRKLDSKYKMLVEYVNSNKDEEHYFLGDIIGSLATSPEPSDNSLRESYGLSHYMNNKEWDDFISIIVDIYNDNYELEGPKYYVKLLAGDEGYLNYQRHTNEYLFVDEQHEDDGYQTKFTMDEIEAIDPRYKAFAVPVEDE